jgi:hypothetical protein
MLALCEKAVSDAARKAGTVISMKLDLFHEIDAISLVSLCQSDATFVDLIDQIDRFMKDFPELLSLSDLCTKTNSRNKKRKQYVIEPPLPLFISIHSTEEIPL